MQYTTFAPLCNIVGTYTKKKILKYTLFLGQKPLRLKREDKPLKWVVTQPKIPPYIHTSIGSLISI